MWTPVLALFVAPLCVSSHVLKRWDNFTVKHSWNEIPQGWKLHGDAPADHVLDLKVALKQDGYEQLIDSLYQVSDPSHASYGQHLSKTEVDALLTPAASTLSLVNEWLSHHRVLADVERSASSDWVSIRVPVAQAERMLGAKYNVYRNDARDEFVVRTLSYSLPSALHGHVDMVAPTTYFGNMQALRVTSFLDENQTPQVDEQFEQQVAAASMRGQANSRVAAAARVAVPASCGSSITPACLRALYNTVDYLPKSTTKNSLGVVGYLSEFANRADLQSFFAKFRPDGVGSNYTTVLVNDGKDDQTKPGTEANLDIQYTEGISYPTPNTYYSVAGSPPFKPDSETTTNTNEPYLDWLQFVLAQSSIPQTFTTSYGDDEQTVPFDYANKVCDLFAQLGARGSSIMFSSGDFGVGGGDCKTNDGMNTVRFQPAFPASCPFVTTVGGTVRVSPEVAVGFSGGGFSNYFAQPSYQSKDVNAYVKTLGIKYKGLYNATGRAYPDVAAQGQAFQVFIKGKVTSVSGTSASSPAFAGVISLLNDYRISLGKPSLGFLNPLLYSSGANALNDIVSGANPGCGTDGFAAVAGWDPVTGLGTPDFVKLQAVVASN